jgi:integrase
VARPKNLVPTYLLHTQSGQARVKLHDRYIYLGPHGSPESLAEYARICAELKANPTTDPVPPLVGSTPALTVNELLLAFLRHAEEHYRRPDGTPTNELKEYRLAIRPVRALYGHTPAGAFGPVALDTVRRHMIGQGWCRTRVNKQVGRVRRLFRWAVGRELIDVRVSQALACLGGLQRGRTDARETDPVQPVPVADVLATLPRLWPTPRAMVELQLLTGMRPGEVRHLKLAEIDRSGELWVYRPDQHKTRHRGKERSIPLGPKARAVLVAFLRGNRPLPAGFGDLDPADRNRRLVAADAYAEAGRPRDEAVLRDLGRPFVVVEGCVVDPDSNLFTPANAREERFAIWRKARKSKVPPSQMNRRKPAHELKKKARDTFTDFGYAAVVRRACERAGVKPWHPNQLRHTFASQVRRLYGLEAAQVLLGHAKADVTQVYAERDFGLAVRVAAEVG